MRVSYINKANGTLISGYVSLEQLENKKRTEEIEAEIEQFFKTYMQVENRVPISVLNELNNTEHFTKSSINHIFVGEINEKGKLVGSHYEGLYGNTAEIIPWTKTLPDKHGVYEAKIMKNINGELKVKNIMSSFFPKEWSPQRVINEINSAFENKVPINKTKPFEFDGLSNSGIKIKMHLNKYFQIKSAYPIQEK